MKFLRKADLAGRYNVTERTVDRWALDGRLPRPIYRGKIPLWSEEAVDAHDRAALRDQAAGR
jgi:hypothetical protein